MESINIEDERFISDGAALL